MAIIVQTTASSSARDYDWLKKSIAGWLHRTDLGDVIPDFVVIAEQRMSSDLRARYLDSITPLADSGGTNWLIETNSGMYLAAAMCAALLYTRNTDEQLKWEAKYAQAISMLDFGPAGSDGLVVRCDLKKKESTWQ